MESFASPKIIVFLPRLFEMVGYSKSFPLQAFSAVSAVEACAEMSGLMADGQAIMLLIDVRDGTISRAATIWKLGDTT